MISSPGPHEDEKRVGVLGVRRGRGGKGIKRLLSGFGGRDIYHIIIIKQKQRKMNFKSSILTFVAACTTIVGASNLQAPVSTALGAHTQVHWTVNPTDIPFTLFLMNPYYIWGYYGTLADNIDASLGVVNVTIPSNLNTTLDYVLRAVDPNNVDRILYSSPIFHVHV